MTAERHLLPKCTNFGFFTTKVYEFWFFYHQSVRILVFLWNCTNIGTSRDVPDVPRRTSVILTLGTVFGVKEGRWQKLHDRTAAVIENNQFTFRVDFLPETHFLSGSQNCDWLHN